MFTYKTSTGKTRTVNTQGVVNDRTVEFLTLAGWKCRGGHYTGLWADPCTGIYYAISQAEAIRRDRLTPRYQFRCK